LLGKKKRNQWDSPSHFKEGAISNLNLRIDLRRALQKNRGHSNFGGDTTRFAQTVSPVLEIPAPFLTPDTMPEGTDSLTLGFYSNVEGGSIIDVLVV